MKRKARLLAFYLPQYYPIPENNKWWGKGFTEWTNVSKAIPLYRGHKQPVFPADLGFYDLRVPEVREQQAELAKNAGIEGFCYWHYWFGNGKRILDRVFMEVLNSGNPDFPFCLAWANQTWTGHWHGKSGEVLIEQKYGGKSDYVSHFYNVLPSFFDKRYVKVDEKPLFLIYNPGKIPNPKEFSETWQNLAIKENLSGIFLVAMINNHQKFFDFGMNGSTWHEPSSHLLLNSSLIERILRKFGYKQKPLRYNFEKIVQSILNTDLLENQFPTLLPNWDNTPRSGKKGLVYENTSPEAFKNLFMKALDCMKEREQDKKIIFLKSWNEWAEGNYLEPDSRYGHSFLQVIKEVNLVNGNSLSF